MNPNLKQCEEFLSFLDEQAQNTAHPPYLQDDYARRARDLRAFIKARLVWEELDTVLSFTDQDAYREAYR